MDIQYVLTNIVVPISITILASAGFWKIFLTKIEGKTMQQQLLLGLAHDSIVRLGMHYISRGWITNDEYENLHLFLYKPYISLGGNGTADRIMKEVDKLPIRNSSQPLHSANEQNKETQIIHK